MSYQVRRNGAVVPSSTFKVPKELSSRDNVEVTPAIAETLLQYHNAVNRPIKQTRVDQYAMEMILDQWVNNGERFLFDSSGNLISGQHRCLAIVKSGKTIYVDMKFGIPPEVRDTEGNGAPRSAADIVRLTTGDADSAFKVKALNGVKKILNRRRTGTSARLALMLAADFERGLNAMVPLIKNKSNLGRGPVAGALVVAAEAHPIKVRELIQGIQKAVLETPAARALNIYLLNDFNGDKEDDLADKILYGVRAHLENKDIKYLSRMDHDNVVEYFVDAIRRNHPLETLKAVAPGLTQ